MPIFMLYTNLSKTQIPEDFGSKLTNILAETLGKPIGYCTVHIIPDQMLTLGNSNEPCAHATLLSIGRLGIEENKKHTNAIMNEINKELGIDQKRMFIRFIDSKPEDIGYNNTTFYGVM